MNLLQFFGIKSGNFFGGVLVFLLFAFAFFLILREIVTWYWKINRIEELLEKIEKNTSKTNGAEKIEQKPQDEPDKNARTSMFDPRMNWK